MAGWETYIIKLAAQPIGIGELGMLPVLSGSAIVNSDYMGNLSGERSRVSGSRQACPLPPQQLLAERDCSRYRYPGAAL